MFDALEELRQELRKELHNGTGEMRTYVLQTAKRASAHRETIQDAYEQKLTAIKEVCTKFFNQIEDKSSDVHHSIKMLEVRQEEWIKNILKPKEITQAKLFTLEAKVQEVETQRIAQDTFFKGILQKLIYAIEQST